MIPSDIDNDQSFHDGAGEHPAVMPLGAEDAGNEMTFGSPDSVSGMRRHASGALLLAVVVIIAIGGLYSMRTLTRASAATENPTELEQSIESFLKLVTGNRSSSTSERPASSAQDDSVLDVLSETYTARQVPLDAVQRNPFIIFEQQAAAPTTTSPGPQAAPVDPRVEQRRARTAQMEQAGSRLRLRSVLMGSTPLANLNNKIVRVNETITVQPEDVTFRVQWIEADGVGLIAEDIALDVSVAITVRINRDN